MPSHERNNREIERKFLVKALPDDLHSQKSTRLIQGYLMFTEDGKELRVRRAGDQYTQTLKIGFGLERTEIEIELTKTQFDALWSATKGRRVAKERVTWPYGRFVVEVDIYEGPLAGLVTAEVEFESRSESAAFDPPAWFGTEVTDDVRYTNRTLVLRGVP